ncbi:MerR family transcriptional regulator [Streptomyces griseorubiginosus]|uniref:MerR family transcriptional regulator n=1 Tax=Streptomyces griseorubiginosus TaxID=67304 RepID=UPI00113FD054|nr:MerR family transcriptional regulator [Streptomyces griseorubiginosus]
MSETDAEVPEGAGVTTGSLARRLGVSPTTLRSWDRRYGLGPAARTEGRHRRWTQDDIAMVLEMCRLTAAGIPPAEAARAAKALNEGPHDLDAVESLVATVAEPDAPPARHASRSGSGLPLGSARQDCKGLARAAVRLDALAVQEQLTAAIGRHGLVVTWEEILAPALQAVGRKWQSAGERYVEVEHLLSWHISATLRHVYVCATAGQETSRTVPVILACLPGEQHTLPLEALNAALAQRGTATLMLGGAVPGDALLAAVERVGPGAVVLWSQSARTANLALVQQVAATRWGIRGARTRSRVLLTGPGWGRSVRPGLLRPRGLHDALVMLDTLRTRDFQDG